MPPRHSHEQRESGPEKVYAWVPCKTYSLEGTPPGSTGHRSEPPNRAGASPADNLGMSRPRVRIPHHRRFTRRPQHDGDSPGAT